MEIFENLRWSPGFGDHTILGWITVVAYIAAFIASVRIYRSSHVLFIDDVSRQKYLWLGIACLLLFLGLNKQLDLQTLLTSIGRNIAYRDGWYRERRTFQLIIVGIALVGGLATMFAMLLVYLRVIKQHLLAILGVCLLIVFILLRMSSFHHLDELFRIRLAGIKIYWLIEWAGIALILWNAKRLRKRLRGYEN